MTLSVKIVPCRLGFKAEIASGYRTGNFLCHGQTDFPVVWADKEKMIAWLKDTGYAIEE